MSFIVWVEQLTATSNRASVSLMSRAVGSDCCTRGPAEEETSCGMTTLAAGVIGDGLGKFVLMYVSAQMDTDVALCSASSMASQSNVEAKANGGDATWDPGPRREAPDIGITYL